ncbi:CBO0543 family protein [Sporomusa aerivorans]|uniref:CBO0543 family protein n=1 Tax=Sporomusa aerivorans TaxID=204936 RepID=UPI00352AA70E
MEVLIFRVCMVLFFLLAIVKWGDWKNWRLFYPTVLFVMVVNLAASFLTYHHILWNYNPDFIVKTQTAVELVNSFVMLPATTFVYLSQFQRIGTRLYQYGYIALWVVFYSCLEFIDHFLVGGISYKNGWSWATSAMFDIAMFSIIRIHYLNPLAAWVLSFMLTAVIITVFNFMSGEFK